MKFDDERINNLSEIRKRRRINRIKTAIIVFIIILFLIPTFLCIFLGIQLNKLQKQVDDLMTYNLSDDGETDSWNYAYASEMTDNKYENKHEDKDNNEANIDNTETTDNTEATTEKPDNSIENAGEKNNSSLTKGETSDNPEKTESKDNTEKSDINKETDNKSDDDKSDVHKDNKDTSSKEDKSETSENKKEDNKKYKNKNKADKKEESSEDKGIATGKYQDKKVYLTFDDGPSENTDKILDILAEYNVKATFFVIGGKDDETKERYKRIVNEGHTLGMHSYSHKYKEIYKSVEDFEKDFTKLWKLLYDTTGYKPTLYRFPGGSSNSVSKNDMKDFIRFLNDKGITYYDWNVVNGDAEGKDYTEKQMIDNVLNGVAKKKTSIVLMHDSQSKNKTVATLPKILDALISGGAQVLPLDENVPLIQQIKASSVK